MAISKPVKVPEKKIDSIDIGKLDAGWSLLGPQNSPNNSFISSKDVELSSDGYMVPRRNLVPFLPDTVEAGFQIFPVLWEGELYYFTADDNKIKFCQFGDSEWTDCDSPGVAATLTTALTGTNNDLTYTAKALGPDGNSITITYVNPGTPSASLSVSVSGDAITVHLATNGSSAITSTASLVLAAIQASTAASALVNVALASGNTGAGVVTALSATNLIDGSGTNIITTQNGGMPKFLRVLNDVLLLNGTNGDKLCYADLTTPGFPIVKFTPVIDPTTVFAAPTATTVALSGTLNIYYAYSWNGAAGETLLSPILTQPISIARDQWETQSTPASLKFTLPVSPPAGATSWNMYIATAPTGGVIQSSDMLQIATALDITATTFLDDGTLSINLGNVAPTANSTDGPRVDQGIVEEGNPILWSDVDNPYNIWIGGSGQNALKFTPSNGGYNAQPELGTNFYPNAIIGFRNGQGIPSLTVLYSNTEGLSKQAVLQQQQVNYGDQTFTVWGTTEQHYGAAGVAAPNSAINYNGKLMFLSTDGFLSADTAPEVQNVLSVIGIASPIDSYVRSIKNSAMPTVIGAGWNNKFMWLSPAGGFDKPQQIVVLDTNSKGIEGNGAWDTLNIPAQWIGVSSPQDDAAFVYIVQGKQSFRLLLGTSTYDTKNGVSVPFSTNATGALIGMGGGAHNQWQAVVQTMFYVLGLVGEMTVGVNYRNQNGAIKTKTKTFSGPIFTPSPAGGWGDPGWGYNYVPLAAWSGEPVIDDSKGGLISTDVRIPVQIDDIASEAQWFFNTPVGYNSYKIKAISFEGIALGVRPDLQ